MNPLKTFNFSILILASIVLFACSPKKTPELLNQLNHEPQQALIVNSPTWDSSKGILQRFENKNGNWKSIGHAIPVTLGRNGTSWGKGLHTEEGLNHFKQEGDGKAPAGIFRLGTSFGYSSAAPNQQKYPYRQATKRDYYVDDVDSTDYNSWVNIPDTQANNPKNLWKSTERMLRDDALYEWGIEIEHNKNPVVTKAGSAIFMHVWKDSETTTSGCTAMSKVDMLDILKWLDVNKNPVLIQMPNNKIMNTKLSR